MSRFDELINKFREGTITTDEDWELSRLIEKGETVSAEEFARRGGNTLAKGSDKTMVTSNTKAEIER